MSLTLLKNLYRIYIELNVQIPESICCIYHNIFFMEDYMKTVQISLNSIDKVKSFVNDLAKYDVDFDLVSGRYVIDAKSIMGIFSLDLSKPIDLNIHAEDNVEQILEALSPYIIK